MLAAYLRATTTTTTDSGTSKSPASGADPTNREWEQEQGQEQPQTTPRASGGNSWWPSPERLLDCEHLVDDLLLGYLGLQPEDLRRVSIPPGIAKADLLFPSKRAYHGFWFTCRNDLQKPCSRLRNYDLKPLSRGETRVVTVYQRSGDFPTEDVAEQLCADCRTLFGPHECHNHNGIWTCEYRMVMALERDASECRRHLPRYLFLKKIK